MINNKKITVCTPIRNEEFFLKFFLPCVKDIADELVITDGGSSDYTIDMIKQFAWNNEDIEVKLKIAPQQGDPYSNSWDESTVRNELLMRSTGDYIVILDADEYIERHAIEHGIALAEHSNKSIVTFKMVPFWGDLYHVRINGPDDPRWFNINLSRILKAGVWQYDTAKHHCTLEHKKYKKSANAYKDIFNAPDYIYHLHYGFGDVGLKYRDNRRGDLGNPDALDEGRTKPNFTEIPNVLVTRYYGPWPVILQSYLDGDVK